jgi:hypothetical protein
MYDLGAGPINRNDAENTSPEQYTGDQFTQNRRLSKPFSELAQELRGNEHDREHQKQIGNGKIVHGEKLERFLGPGPKDESVLEEWEIDLVGILCLYGDPSALFAASHLEVGFGSAGEK